MPETSDNKPENVAVSVAFEMKGSVVSLAGPRQATDTRESMIARAARRAGISYRQAKAFFYGEVVNPRVEAVERVRAAVRAAARQSRAEAIGRDELGELRTRMDRIERLLAAAYSDGGSGGAAAVRQSHLGANREASAVHRSLAGPGERQ